MNMTLYGKSDLVDVIKLRILRGDNYPRLSGWTQLNRKDPSKKEAMGDLTT